MIEHTETIEDVKKSKDQAYRERNQLVKALSHIYPSFLTKHPENDEKWENDWRNIVVIILPFEGSDDSPGLPSYKIPNYREKPRVHGMQLTWHIHDSELPLFDHLEFVQNVDGRQDNDMAEKLGMDFGYNELFKWDGHSTEEKYKRLRKFFEKK